MADLCTVTHKPGTLETCPERRGEGGESEAHERGLAAPGWFDQDPLYAGWQRLPGAWKEPPCKACCIALRSIKEGGRKP